MSNRTRVAGHLDARAAHRHDDDCAERIAAARALRSLWASLKPYPWAMELMA